MQLEFPVSTSANPSEPSHARFQFCLGLGKGNIAKICDLPGQWAVDQGRIGPSSSQPASLLAACHTRRWCHSAIQWGGLAYTNFPLGQVSSPVSFYLWRMAAGGGGQGRPEWGRGRRLTQLRGIASGGCLDDSDWKSTIVPSTHAVSEAYRSFKNPTISWNTSTSLARGWQAGPTQLPGLPSNPSTHSSCADPGVYQQDAGLNSKTC